MANRPSRQEWMRQQQEQLIRRPVEAGTAGQSRYLKLLRSCDVTVVNGPAGTGKTFLPMGVAIHALFDQQSPIKQIVVSRPMVPTDGEDTGFIPGDLDQKIAPWVAPVYDSIRKFCRGDREYYRLIDHQEGQVRACPLAVMRGLTLDNAFIILDEAQNTTAKQMEMFLTRMGKNSQVVITGDLTQSDLDDDQVSGLELCISKFEGYHFRTGQVGVCHLGLEDIMRRDLIGELLIAIHRPGEPGENGEGFYPHNRLNDFGPRNGFSR